MEYEWNWLTLLEVSEKLGLHRRTVQRLVERGELNAYQFGRQWRVKQADLDNYIETCKNK